MKIGNRGVYIPSADAKDLFLANYSCDSCTGYSVRHASGGSKGEINTRRFINTLDYSLDLIKLQEVYEREYRRMDFTTCRRGKEYCRSVINVTFKYSVKEYNRFFGKVYVKYGYLPDDVKLTDGVCIENGELIAVKVDDPIENPVDPSLLGKYFIFDDGAYRLHKPMKVLHTVAQLRDRLYEGGFIIDGVRYRRFKRSGGSSRVGKCLFIDERLYDRMHRWELCGLKVSDGQQIDLAAFEAYIALTLSSIIGTIQINPENFLVIDDYSSLFSDDVIATRIGQDGWLESRRENVSVKNSIWDGQSLIDPSLMAEYAGHGMILLRSRFFKSACFNTNIQQWFRDNGITEVSQLSGYTCAERIEDIRIITTPSSIKYTKFGRLEKWLSMLTKDNCFGVVKHEKPTHFFDGRMVEAHYQLLNTLQLSQAEVDDLVRPSLDYLSKIVSDPTVLRYHIQHAGEVDDLEPVSTANDVVYQMLGITDMFASTKLCRDFVLDISKSFRKNLRRGHVMISGNYSTLLGNPIEMLEASIGRFLGESQIGKGCICSKRFAYGAEVLGSRSPHVTMGNVWLTQNRYNPEIARYINLTNEIVCINSIDENLLMRLSGADFDSDTALLTDNWILIKAARRNYDRFLVPTSMVEARQVVRHYTMADMADLDISTSVNKIGEIVNLSQELNTKLWDTLNRGGSYEDVEALYHDIAKLDVLSGIEIDKAKREFDVDSAAEIRRMKKKYLQEDDDGRKIKPNFFGRIARMKGYYDSERKNYKFHDTAMDYLQHSLNSFRVESCNRVFIPFSDLLISREHYSSSSVWYPQVNRILDLVRSTRSQIQAIWSNGDDIMDNQAKRILVSQVRDECSQYIKSIQLSQNTAYRLLLAIEKPENKDIARSLFYMLFSLPNESFLRLLSSKREGVGVLCEDECGDVEIYGFRFSRIQPAKKADLAADGCKIL